MASDRQSINEMRVGQQHGVPSGISQCYASIQINTQTASESTMYSIRYSMSPARLNGVGLGRVYRLIALCLNKCISKINKRYKKEYTHFSLQLQPLSQSKNFTSSDSIPMPPTIPINHYGDSRNQQNRTARPILLFHANVFRHRPALNTLIFSS